MEKERREEVEEGDGERAGGKTEAMGKRVREISTGNRETTSCGRQRRQRKRKKESGERTQVAH